MGLNTLSEAKGAVDQMQYPWGFQEISIKPDALEAREGPQATCRRRESRHQSAAKTTHTHHTRRSAGISMTAKNSLSAAAAIALSG